ncbi:uncharacterized protein EI90DRAFT_2902656, partial [Cantharellus anzutake]|uniref:uncharacterized protein n=1 Tax=Cantharellus anzutake TaxID=1750568 RepID=UPI0019039AF7
GWSIIDRLFVLNGTFFIVTDDPDRFPAIRMIVSSGYEVHNGAEEVAKREPTDKDMQIISTKRAKTLFRRYANRLDGVTFLNNDPPQFIQHYYHFSAELFFGLWRTYSSLDTRITEDGITSLPAPRRFIFTKTNEWRDYANMNQYLVEGAFPSMTIEGAYDWEDRSNIHKPYVFDRVVLADRGAAMRGVEFVATERTASEAFAFPSSRPWWSPVRSNVVEFAGLNRSAGAGTLGKPVITYISRQDWGRRMLLPEAHDSLVAALKGLEEEYGYEVNIVSMDKLDRHEQIRLAGRTTIMCGVHGNGLTSLLWMNPTPRATVIEFFYPGGFAYDYEWTARALGVIHYGFWGNRSFTSPKLPPVGYPEGFQGNEIPLDGQKVAELIRYRLELEEEADD